MFNRLSIKCSSYNSGGVSVAMVIFCFMSPQLTCYVLLYRK